MSYGIQTFSGTTGAKLFDSNEPFQGVATISSGTISNVGTVQPSIYAAGVLFEDRDIILIKPSVTVANNHNFLVTGHIKVWSTSPKRYKLQIYIPDGGTAYTSMDYVILRSMTSASTPNGDYGLQCYDHNGSYLTKTFDSRAFTTGQQIQITNVSFSRYGHTDTFGSVNNDEWYSPAHFTMGSASGFLKYVGIHYANNSTHQYLGPFPHTFSGSGISHYGQRSTYGNYVRYDSDYKLRGETF